MFIKRFVNLSSFCRKYTSSSKMSSDKTKILQQFEKYEGGQITLSKSEEDGIAYLCIDHPTKKNGFSGKMMVDLHNRLTELESWTTGKGIIFYGKGDMFCSGGYLDTVKQICNSEDGYKMCGLMQESFCRLRNLPLVSVCLIHGKALGGGAEAILSTDFRLMTQAAEISYVEAKMGVGTGWGGGYFLKELVGRSNALNLLLTCKKIGSEEALRLGLINEIIPEERANSEELRLESAKGWLMERIGNHNSFLINTVKNIINATDLESERLHFSKSWGGPEQIKALGKNIKHN